MKEWVVGLIGKKWAPRKLRRDGVLLRRARVTKTRSLKLRVSALNGQLAVERAKREARKRLPGYQWYPAK